METKFLSDGRKVAIIGQLNNVEFIVQEIFVTASGDEIPSGERFTAKSLHDEPVESYKAREERNLESRINKLKSEVNKLDADIKSAKSEAQTQAQILKQSKLTISTLMDDPDLDLLCDVIAGNIKWVVDSCSYRMEEPIPFNESMDQKDFSDKRVRLLSLFGNSDGNISYRLNRYRDDSGNWSDVLFFRNDNEMKSFLTDEMSKRIDKLTHEEVLMLRKYIDVPNSIIEKIKSREIAEITAVANRTIKEAQERLNKQIKSINSLE